MDLNEYREAYANLGEERVQVVEDVDEYDSNRTTTEDEIVYTSAEDRFFGSRLDTNWVKLPGVLKYNRRLRKRIFMEGVSQILMQLEPAVTFNAAEVWKHEINRENKKQSGTTTLSKTDAMKEKNYLEQQNKKFVAEVTKIRNSKSNLLAILRDVKIPDARVMLYVQILKNAYDDFNRSRSNLQHKKLLYEVVWALNEIGLPKINAPKPADNKLLNIRDPSLVYDNYKDAESLLKHANKLLAEEEDLIKLQLVDMSDSLPPLSKFSSGFRLDAWQKRVLTWIDAGKSVVICAPTSSGKTVLSSYVAIIFKSHIYKEDGKEEKSSKGGSKSGAKLQGMVGDEEVDDEDDIEYEEHEYKKIGTTKQVSDGDLIDEVEDFASRLVAEDAKKRADFARLKKELQLREMKSVSGSNQRVLFVVPTEPLVWQVAAYFTKLMKEEGDRQTRVALVTDQFIFRPKQKIDVVPQIVVGTPLALESALTKPFGLTGREETKGIPAGNILPGGFDHFDWVIYDEVHALDGPEGAALQRLIRSMHCPFLALSATIGNAGHLRSWMESVKGEQLSNVEGITVAASDHTLGPVVPHTDVGLNIVGRSDTSSIRIGALKTLISDVLIFDDTTVSDLAVHASLIWSNVHDDPTVASPLIFLQNTEVKTTSDDLTLVQAGLLSSDSSTTVIEAVSGVKDGAMTIIGHQKSQQKVSVLRKCFIHLPTINVLEDRKVSDLQRLLSDLFPFLLREAVQDRASSKFSVKNTELKDDHLLLVDFLDNSGRTVEVTSTASSFEQSSPVVRLIEEFNRSNGGEEAGAVKSYPVKLQISLCFDPFEVFVFDSTTVHQMKEHILALWTEQYPASLDVEAMARTLSPSIQANFRTTRLIEDKSYTLAKFGLFHPSVTHNQRIVTAIVQLDVSSQQSVLKPVGTTVVGRPKNAVRMISLKTYLSRAPSEVLITKGVSVRELKDHLASIWKENPPLKDYSVSSSLFVAGLSNGPIDFSSETLRQPLVVINKSAPETNHSLLPEMTLSQLTVVGKGVQRPFRMTLVRTSGTEDEIGGSSIRSDIVVFKDTTVLEVKKQICTIWKDLNADPAIQASHVRFPVQVLFQSKDLIDDEATLASYGLLDASVSENERMLVVRSAVHLLVHQGRFINLQRYIWHQDQTRGSKLTPISPLAAVASVEELQQGILLQSSLSFTSKDCYRTFEEMKKIFPTGSVEELSPYKFFKKRERITLQRSKEYEDLLKLHITRLSNEYPSETSKLLASFKVFDTAREFNLCDLVMELKQMDMLPCLPFHLNTFEAIKLFQQLLGDLEYRQKVSHPTYYLDLQADVDRRKKENDSQISAQGKNEKNIEEIEKTLEIVSDVDIYAPHPSFTACKGSPLSQQELDQLIADMERYDGFEKRDSSAKGQNLAILRHSLIRGLRRGIGLFIDEVSFPSYRRAIQRLASNGKLGVVISDSSLAFGVNMPFRSCIFCGEMRGTLDELMAQQMSGRAGRRGLDEQGNVIYAGIRVPMLRKIMIGKISNITGRKYPPRYDTLFLQAILSPRHTGYARTEIIGRRTLSEFIDGVETEERYSMSTSKQIMIDLGFVSATKDKDYQPNYRRGATFGQLTAVWEMRSCIYESITIGMLLREIVAEFTPIIAPLSLNEKKRNIEVMEPHIFSFFSILVQLIGRTPARKHGTKLLDLHYFSHQSHRDFYDRWAQKFAAQQSFLEQKGLDHLKNPVPPGADLDGTFFQCAIDRNHVHTLDETSKQEMKQMIWHVGGVLLLLNKASHIESAYHRVGHFLFRIAFEKLRYLNSELIAAVIDFDNIAAADAERRTDAKTEIPKLPQAANWTDLERHSWHDAIVTTVEDHQEASGKLSPSDLSESLTSAVDNYLALGQTDLPFIRHCLTSSNLNTKEHIVGIINTLLKSTFVTKFPTHLFEGNPGKTKYLVKLGMLVWYCGVFQRQAARSFRIYLQAWYDSLDEDEAELLEEAMLTWEKMSFEDFKVFLPNLYRSNRIGTESTFWIEDKSPLDLGIWTELQERSQPFLEFLKQEEEEDDEDEEEED